MSEEKKSIEYNLFEDFANIDAENIMVGAVKQAVEKSAKSEPTKKSQKIEDFGEKIGGARKDLYAAYCDLVKVATEGEIEKVPLSKSFSKPDYKKLLESGHGESIAGNHSNETEKIFMDAERMGGKSSDTA